MRDEVEVFTGVGGVRVGGAARRLHHELHAERATIAGRVLLSTEAFSGELDRRAQSLKDGGLVLLGLAALTQLFYVGFYLEALLHWLGRDAPPTIVVAFYFWVALVSFSANLGMVLSTWEARPWHWRR